jgi:hypothetical protein
VALPGGELLAAGLRGSLYRSTDEGKRWSRIDSHSESSITQLLVRRAMGWPVWGRDGLRLQSQDGGASFKTEVRPDHLGLTAAVVNAQGQLVLLSKQGQVRRGGQALSPVLRECGARVAPVPVSCSSILSVASVAKGSLAHMGHAPQAPILRWGLTQSTVSHPHDEASNPSTACLCQPLPDGLWLWPPWACRRPTPLKTAAIARACSIQGRPAAPPTEFGTVGVRAAATRPVICGTTQASVRGTRPEGEQLFDGLHPHDRAHGGWRPLWLGRVLPVLDMSMNLSVPTPAGPVGLSGKNRSAGRCATDPGDPAMGAQPRPVQQLQLAAGCPPAPTTRTVINAGTNHAVTLVPSPGSAGASRVVVVSAQLQPAQQGHQLPLGHRRQTLPWASTLAPGQRALGGYLYQQISDDVAPGLTNGNRSRALALGPALTYFQPGSGLPLVSMHIYRETQVRNRTQGTSAAIRLGWSF